ncbi:MAG TPA: VanZ family protein [Marmoricola sp.]|nr:VanZ family protein [Marmoricola sp.]
MHRTLAAVLLALYSVFVYRLTLEPVSAGAWMFSLADRVATHASDGSLEWSQTEVIANVVLFVPAGFLLAILTNRPWLSVFLCVLVSAGIETAQLLYLPGRVPSMADVGHNGLGGLIGAAVAWPLCTRKRQGPRRLDITHSPRPVGRTGA